MTGMAGTVCTVMAMLLASSALAASPCSTTGSADAAVKPVSLQDKSDASLLVSMSMLVRMQRLNRAGVARSGSTCERARFEAAGGHYVLMGENDDKGGVRRAIPDRKDLPAAVLLPVTDMKTILAAAQQKQKPPVDGYLLATVSGDDITGWRLYTAIPADAVLETDIGAALAGRDRFLFRSDLKTNSIALPAS
jgi:hypothetical protein